MKTLEKKEGSHVTKEGIIAELENCDFDTFVKAMNITYGQTMAVFIGELNDEVFYSSVLKFIAKNDFGAMNLMNLVHGLSNGNSFVDTMHKYVIYTPSLDDLSFQSYEDLDDLKNCCELAELADLLLEENKYKVLFPNV